MQAMLAIAFNPGTASSHMSHACLFWPCLITMYCLCTAHAGRAQHHYDSIKDLSTLDKTTVKGYATFTALTTWRELMQATSGNKQQKKTEL